MVDSESKQPSEQVQPVQVPVKTEVGNKPASMKPWADGPFPLMTTTVTATGDHSDPFNIAATHMALVHNLLIRGLNAIYLQAPNIKKPQDKADFIGFAKSWSALVHIHHNGEEQVFFKEIENRAGVEGVMEPNVEQHKAFSSGFDEFDKYLDSFGGKGKKPDEFDGQKLNEIIDGFGTLLVQHLHDEIPTLLALRSYGDEKMKLAELIDEEGERQLGAAPKTTVLAFAAVNTDADFEGGIHAGVPPMPWFVKFMFRYIFTIPNWRFWRFAPCTRSGKRRELPFASEG